MYQVVFTPCTSAYRMRCYDFETLVQARNFVQRCKERAQAMRLWCEYYSHSAIEETYWFYPLGDIHETPFCFIDIIRLEDGSQD